MNTSTDIQHDRLAVAEQSLKDAGFVRDSKQAIWFRADDFKRAKVIRDETTKKFYISAK